jgi:N6-L-threonylcarbamoyladenine synthase
MPVFEAGISFAKTTSALTGAPIYPLSHQFNHLMAVDYFEDLAPDPCLALHLSGGTTELLRVDSWAPGGVSLIGGTKDISFGKLVDRIGVSMGGTFPAGPWLDQLAGKAQPLPLKSRIHRSDAWWNLSGVETWFQKEMVGKQPREVVAATLFYQIAEALAVMIADQADRLRLKRVVIAGGVAASQTIQKQLVESLQGKGLDLRFVPGKFSSDHALGCAWQAWRKSHESHHCQSN